jgi:hypothetical protein
MATAEDAANYIALEATDYDGYGGSNGFGFARATTDEVAEALGVDSETAYKLLKSAARKGLVTQDKERRKELGAGGRFGVKKVGWAIWEVHLTEAQTRKRDPEHPDLTHSPNASYYVWVLAPHSDTPLSSEGPYGPHPLHKAEQMARIGAQAGIHDRAVSVGKDPEARGFRIERRYQARTGQRLV